MKKCKFCEEPIPADAVICPFCGEPQGKPTRTCPYCDETIDANVTHCSVCGETLEPYDSKSEGRMVSTAASDSGNTEHTDDGKIISASPAKSEKDSEQPDPDQEQVEATMPAAPQESVSHLSGTEMDALVSSEGVPSEDPQQDPAPEEPAATIVETSHGSKSRGKMVLGIVVACLLMAGIGVAVGYFIGQGRKAQKDKYELATNNRDSLLEDKSDEHLSMDEAEYETLSSATLLTEDPERVDTFPTQDNIEEADIPMPHGAEMSSGGDRGRYTFASERLLTEEDLAGLSPYELKIMRNEIFARHGYIFKTKDMAEYFNAQSWYTPLSSDVADDLSEIEKANIMFIKSHELK